MIVSYTGSKAQKRFESVIDACSLNPVIALLSVPNALSLSLHYAPLTTKNYGVRLDVHFESIRGW